MCLLVANGLAAQEQITAKDFLDRLEGRTATFSDFQSGRVIGIEQFVTRTRSVWTRQDGSCAFGTIYTKDEQVCFLYDDEPDPIPHCWTPFALRDRLWVAGTTPGEVQEITDITDDPVTCDLPSQS